MNYKGFFIIILVSLVILNLFMDISLSYSKAQLLFKYNWYIMVTIFTLIIKPKQK